MATKVIKCTCVHEYQDSLYGKGNRAANEMRTGQVKCTVCGTVSGSKGLSQAEVLSAKAASKSVEKPVTAEPQKEESKSSGKGSSKTSKKDNKGSPKKETKKKSLKGTKR